MADALVRADFAFDGMDGLLGWQEVACEAGSCNVVPLVKEKGPSGHPVVRLSGAAKKVTFASHALRLVPGESYRLSAAIRAHGSRRAKVMLSVVDKKGVPTLSVDLPATKKDGGWVTLAHEGVLRAKAVDKLCFAVILQDLAEGAWVDVSEPRLTPLSEKAQKGSSPCDAAMAMVPRIVPVWPLLSEVDAATGEMLFRANVKTNGCVLIATVNGRPLGPLPEGQHEVNVRLVDRASGKVRVENTYPFIAKRKVAPSETGRRLNNFVTELLNAPLKDGEYAFENPRAGYVFIALDGAGTRAEAFLANEKEPVVIHRAGEPLETTRYLSAGRYRLRVRNSGRGRLIVRLVKPLTAGGKVIFNQGCEFRKPWRENYGWEYHRRFVLPCCTHYESPMGWARSKDPEVRSAFVAEMRARGKRVFHQTDVRPFDMVMRSDAKALRRQISENVYFCEGMGLYLDENGINQSMRELNLVGEELWRVANMLDSRPLYADWFNLHCTDVKDCTALLAPLAAIVNAGCGTGYIASETYVSARTPQTLDRILDRLLRNQRTIADNIPAVEGRIVQTLCSYQQIGEWTCHLWPEVNAKVALDRLAQRLACDPAFADVGGLAWSTPMCSEELYRWGCRLMRHYGLEGRTNSLAEAYGWHWNPRTVEDGDFLQGLAKWRVVAAEKDGVSHGSRKGYAWRVQQRCGAGADAGDTYALLTSSAKGPNSLSQTVRNLDPGKLYSLEFATSDYADVCNPKSVEKPNADLHVEVKGMPFDDFYTVTNLLGRAGKGRVRSARHVFRATAREAELVFSDWHTDGKPCGPEGHAVMLNYISINPYFEMPDEMMRLCR